MGSDCVSISSNSHGYFGEVIKMYQEIMLSKALHLTEKILGMQLWFSDIYIDISPIDDRRNREGSFCCPPHLHWRGREYYKRRIYLD